MSQAKNIHRWGNRSVSDRKHPSGLPSRLRVGPAFQSQIDSLGRMAEDPSQEASLQAGGRSLVKMGWAVSVRNGIYKITDEGRKVLEECRELIRLGTPAEAREWPAPEANSPLRGLNDASSTRLSAQ